MPTTRFGLSDSIDHALIDAVLAALEVHDHKGGDRLGDPEAPVEVIHSAIGGTLPGGVTYYYRWSMTDRYGFETAASPEISVTMPDVLLPPAAPNVVTTSGGLLDPGSYYYFLTTIGDGLEETTISQPTIVQLVGGDASVRVFLPNVVQPGTFQYRVWRQGPGEVGPTKIGTFTPDDGEFLDDGSVPADDCACDPENMPPAFNQTNSTNRVLITLPSGYEVSLADANVTKSWRLYRATTSGGYSENSLLAEIRQRDPEITGPLVDDFVDDGTTPLSLGRPLAQSQTLLPSVQIRGGGGGGASLVLASTAGTRWKLLASKEGTLITRSTDAEPATAVLVDSDMVRWRLGVTADGTLTIEDGADPLPGDTVYTVDDPLILPTPDPTYIYSVVIDAGLLATTEA